MNLALSEVPAGDKTFDQYRRKYTNFFNHKEYMEIKIDEIKCCNAWDSPNVLQKVKKQMKKILAFFLESNRWKHLVGGFAVAVFTFSPLHALYAAAVAASCLELKDRLYADWWDWKDWTATVVGGVLAALVLLIL